MLTRSELHTFYESTASRKFIWAYICLDVMGSIVAFKLEARFLITIIASAIPALLTRSELHTFYESIASRKFIWAYISLDVMGSIVAFKLEARFLITIIASAIPALLTRSELRTFYESIASRKFFWTYQVPVVMGSILVTSHWEVELFSSIIAFALPRAILTNT